MFVDTHIHTKEYSGDAVLSRADLVAYAVANPSSILCTTEHYDYNYPDKNNQLIFDVEKYFTEYNAIKIHYEETVQKPLPILCGVEYGYMENIGPYYDNMSSQLPFDCVICSAHYFDGCDPYFDRQIYDNGKKSVYSRYLETIVHSIENCNGFDIVGHFDYISRYAPYPDKKIYYRDFPDLFDTIFSLCIQRGRSIELNTRTSAQFKAEKHADYLFDVDILLRYKEMGGELVSFGSDAHHLDSIMYLFDETMVLLKSSGFQNLVYFKKRSPIFVSI